MGGMGRRHRSPEAADAEAWRGFRGEVGEALGIVALFVVVGLGGAWLGGGPYPPEAMADEPSQRSEPVGRSEPDRVWLVDGFNLLHAAVLQGRDRAEWWREEKRGRVLDLVDEFPEPAAEIWVVFDGEDPETPEAGERLRVRQVFAPSADDWLVRRVKEIPRGSPVSVVTADRQLAARARHHGADVVSPRAFAERCRPRRGDGDLS